MGATVHSGTWLNEATHRYPAVVLGAKAAQRLGIRSPHPDAQVLIGGELFTVVGILDAVPLAPELDYAALVGWPAAEAYLGAVALLVGGVGVANTMVISVLERRAEIGLRRSLGATRGQIRLQFLAESLLRSMLGGVAGVGVGAVVTAAFAAYQGWPATYRPGRPPAG